MFEDEDEFFNMINKVNNQIRQDRKKETELVNNMTEEEQLKHDQGEIDEVNRLIKENGQKVIFVDTDTNK